MEYPYKLLGEKINSFSDFEKLLEKIAPQFDEIEKEKEIPNIDDCVEFVKQI